MGSTVRLRDSRSQQPHPLAEWLRRNRLWWIGGLAVIILGALLWALWPGKQEEPPRARQYLEFTACLLTGERGLAEPAAAPVWAGLQEASLSTRAKVQYLAVTGPQTVENALPFLNSLAQTGCNLIFAAGEVPLAAVERGAATFPDARFFPIGPGSAHANITPVSGATPDEVRAAVAATLTASVEAAT